MAGRSRKRGGLLSLLATGVSGLVGLATEVHAYRKAQEPAGRNDSETAGTSGEEDEDAPPGYNEVTFGNEDGSGPTSDRHFEIQPLPLPVIIPQRRPNSISRGFVRAYSPDLWYYKGISQQTFLEFLEGFDTASQASPVFQVVNIAATAVTTAVTVALKAFTEAQGRYRTNNYLDKANEELFHAKNLHCMIMTFKPEAQNNVFLNFNFSTSAYGGMPAGVGTSERVSDATSRRDFGIPEAAPLIFPKPSLPSEKPVGEGSTSEESTEEKDQHRTSERNRDGLPTTTGTQKPSSWKITQNFISDYKDRRAQAIFAAKNGPDSKLAIPGAADPERFASRFSDPNHPVNSGSPLALLTGGMIEGPHQIKAKRAQLPGRPQMGTTTEQMKGAVGGMARERRRLRPGLLGGLRGTMEQGVLYLLIAEIPSDEDARPLDGETTS